jgi:hypothetical protein
MRTNGLLEVKSCSVRARVLTYVLLFVPVGYLAVATRFAYLAIEQFDHRFIAMSQSEVRIPFWILSVFSAVFCVYAAKVTWSSFTKFRDLNTSYMIRRALKNKKLRRTHNFEDYFSRVLGDKRPKPRKSVLQKVDDLLPW